MLENQLCRMHVSRLASFVPSRETELDRKKVQKNPTAFFSSKRIHASVVRHAPVAKHTAMNTKKRYPPTYTNAFATSSIASDAHDAFRATNFKD